MAYSRKRPTGGYGVSIFATPTKDTFEDAVAQAGVTVEVVRVDKGQWNERREWKVGSEVIGVAFKGERPDWAGMASAVEAMAAGNY